MSYLAGGETPRFAEDFLEEGRLDAEILADDVQAEQVPIDACACHGVAVERLVVLGGFAQKLDSVFFLESKRKTKLFQSDTL